MRDRIARHRADRDQRWRTVEAPRDLAAAIDAANGADAVVLVDCLTIWISNLMLAEAVIDAATRDLWEAIQRFEGQLILVANDVGLVIVPDHALARDLPDEMGGARGRGK